MTSDDGFVIELLLDKNAVTETAVQSARDAVGANSEDTSESAVLKQLLDELNIPNEQVIGLLADEFNMEVGYVNEVELEDSVKDLFPYEVVEKYKVFPLEVSDAEAEIAISDPFDFDVVDNISHLLKRPLVVRLSSLTDIENAISFNYEESSDSINAAFAEATEALASGENSGSSVGGDDEDSPIVRYVHTVIAEALNRRASDIHMEPLEKRFRIRYRIDGVLHEIENPPKRLQPTLLSRIKLMANVSIAEKRVILLLYNALFVIRSDR